MAARAKTRLQLAGLMLVCLALVVWRFWPPAEEAQPDAADTAPAVETTPDERPTRGRGADSETPAETKEPEPVAEPTTESDTPETAPDIALGEGVVRLTGTVRNPDGAPVAGAHVSVSPVYRDFLGGTTPLETRTARDGKFAVNAAALFDSHAVKALVVTGDHPDYLAGEVRVETPGDPTSVTAHVKLAPAAFATGRVVDDSGAPLAGCVVAAFPDPPGDAWSPLGDDVTGKDGTYRVRMRPRANHYVFAARAERVPAFVRISAADESASAGDLVLQDGVRLGGRVLLVGKGPFEGANVAVWTRWLGTSLQVGDVGLTFGEGKAGLWPQYARTDENGRYEVSGLIPGETRVVVSIPGAALGVQHELDRDFGAPTDTADFDVELAKIVVQVRTGGEPMKVESFMFHSKSGTNGVATDENGRLEMLVLAGRTYRVDMRPEGYERVRREITAPDAGSEHVETIDLVMQAPRPTLSVELVPVDGGEITKCAMWFFLKGKKRLVEFSPDAWREARLVKGRWEVADVDPGTYRVLVKPGTGVWGGEGHFLPIETEVDLAAGGRLELRFDAVLGGRLNIAAEDTDGKSIDADCKITDAAGNEIPLLFKQGPTLSGGLDKGENLLEPPLPAGRYTIEFTADGYASKAVEVLVEKGKTTDVVMQLAKQ